MKKAQHRACIDYFAISYRNQRQKTWTDIRRHIFASKKPEPRIAPLHHRDPVWAQRLNSHFVAAGAEVATELSAAPQGAALSPRPPRVVSDSFKVRTVTLPELSYALKGLGRSRACGEDGVTVQMLRATFPVIGPHLMHVVNSSLRTGEVPRRWKEACVVPVYKKGDRTDPGNFRPLSINIVPGKLCEKCVCNQLAPYLDQNHVPIVTKSARISIGHSTETAMIDSLSYSSTRVWNGLDQSAGFIVQFSPCGFGLDWIRNSPTQRILDWTGSRNVQCISHI